MRSRAISLCLAVLASGNAAAQTCAAPTAPLGYAARVRERLEIELTDGRVLRQIGLAPYPSGHNGPAWFETARRSLESRVQGSLLSGPAPPPAEDRWGRVSAHLQSRGENIGVWLAEMGLVRVAPEAGDPCGRPLLIAEAKARQAKLGLWADPHYSVLAADNGVALTTHAGEFVLAEGRILRLGQTSARFYLDLGPARGVDLSVTISKQSAKVFGPAGVRIEALPGQRVRVRGILENRPAPTVDIVSPFALEIIGR